MTHQLYPGGMSGFVTHSGDLSPLRVVMGAENTLVIAQDLPFEGRAESITTTLDGLRDLIALAVVLEPMR